MMFRIVFFTCAVLFAGIGAARAEGPFPWRGSFLEAEVGAHRRIYGPFDVSAEMGYLGFPGDEHPHEARMLAGARWNRNSRWKMDLLFGYERAWLEDVKEDRFVIGVRKRLSFPSLRLRLRLEQDHVLHKEHGRFDYDYHGDYAIGYRLLSLTTPEDEVIIRDLKFAVRGDTVGVKGTLNPLEAHIGFRIDHEWSSIEMGPHIAFTRPDAYWQFEIQHFARFWGDVRGHAVRIVLRLHL